MTKDELAGLEERLRSRSWSDSQDALADAVARGKQAEPLLVQLLTESDRYRAPAVAAALGDMRGPGPADAVLRSLVERTGPGTDDQRCASLLALAKRLGRAATDDYLQALARGSAALKDYASSAWPPPATAEGGIKSSCIFRTDYEGGVRRQ